MTTPTFDPGSESRRDASKQSGACAAFAEGLGRLVDGELESGDRAAVEAHLLECKACERLAVQWRQLDAMVAAAPVPEVTAGEWDRVWQSVRASASEPAGILPGTPRVRRLWAWIGAAAAAVLIAAAIYLAGGRADAPGRTLDTARQNDGVSAPADEYAESVSGPKPVFLIEDDVPVIDYDSPEPQRP